MGGDAESTRTDDYVGIRELATSRNGQRRVRETDGTRLHNVVRGCNDGGHCSAATRTMSVPGRRSGSKVILFAKADNPGSTPVTAHEPQPQSPACGPTHRPGPLFATIA